METWLITRYLLARFQQLKEHLSGFRTAKPVRVLRLWVVVGRRNLRVAGLYLAKLWSRCVLTSQGIWSIRKLRGSMRHKMAILRRVVSLGMRGAETREWRGLTNSALTNKAEWLNHGYEMGWISKPVCYWHDMIPLSKEEEAVLEEEDELCALVVRFYE